jgi:hypothetical protein
LLCSSVTLLLFVFILFLSFIIDYYTHSLALGRLCATFFLFLGTIRRKRQIFVINIKKENMQCYLEKGIMLTFEGVAIEIRERGE